MRFPVLATVACSQAFGVTYALRSLPADIQVDLLFPRNDTTYAPTQWFPIIFGIQNLESVLPMDLHLSIRVMSSNWGSSNVSHMWEDFSVAFSDPSDASTGKFQFHNNLVNMTNGTTDTYTIAWDLEIWDRCFANNTGHPERDTGGNWWSNMRPYPYPQLIKFHTAPGALLPDIEAEVNSCPEPDESTSVALRINEVRTTTVTKQWCPVFDTDVNPNKCAYKLLAKELASNISDMILHEMHCGNGTWQTITAPCIKEESPASSLRTIVSTTSAVVAFVAAAAALVAW